jgi:hypothetical protein
MDRDPSSKQPSAPIPARRRVKKPYTHAQDTISFNGQHILTSLFLKSCTSRTFQHTKTHINQSFDSHTVALHTPIAPVPYATTNMSNYPRSTQSSSRSTPEPDFPSSSSSSFTHHSHNDTEDHEASEQLRRNITEISRESAVNARNARKGSLNEEYMRKLVEEVEVELGLRKA